MSDSPTAYLQAYTGDACQRGDPATPPPTIPSNRREAWLKGWADQRALDDRQTAQRKLSRYNRFVAEEDETQPLFPVGTHAASRKP
jgi:hypothetical protein